VIQSVRVPGDTPRCRHFSIGCADAESAPAGSIGAVRFPRQRTLSPIREQSISSRLMPIDRFERSAVLALLQLPGAGVETAHNLRISPFINKVTAVLIHCRSTPSTYR